MRRCCEFDYLVCGLQGLHTRHAPQSVHCACPPQLLDMDYSPISNESPGELIAAITCSLFIAHASKSAISLSIRARAVRSRGLRGFCPVKKFFSLMASPIFSLIFLPLPHSS